MHPIVSIDHEEKHEQQVYTRYNLTNHTRNRKLSLIYWEETLKIHILTSRGYIYEHIISRQGKFEPNGPECNHMFLYRTLYDCCQQEKITSHNITCRF